MLVSQSHFAVFGLSKIMPKEFKLPDLGEGVAEGEIVKWLVSEGSDIKEDQPLVEVMTDKATVQIPSPSSGKIGKILAKAGQTVKVGASIVTFEIGDEASQQVTTPGQQSQQAAPSAQVAEQAATQVRAIATPSTRKLARELDVEIESVRGTGPSGRITDDDVRNEAKKKKDTTQETAPPEATVAKEPTQDERQAIHGIRKRIADKMAKSSRTTAAVTHVDEVDLTSLIALREQLKPIAEAHGVKITYLPFIMKACISALNEYQYFNSSIDDEKEEVVLKKHYNIGFATDTPNGLIVPVVKDADKKGIFQIAKEIEILSGKAREGKIALEDIQEGTFTITNIGSLGGIISTPIINVPEVAILGVHKIQKRPVVIKDKIEIRDMTYLALSFDHRIVDGADAARFTSKIIKILENPALLMLEDTKIL